MKNRNVDVVIVEDSPTQALQLEFILYSNGYTVRTAHSGEKALELVEEKVPDLVVTDIVMPGMDGYEVCRRLREGVQTADIPVVLLTSLSEPTEALRAINAGADAFLTKPYQEAFLLQRLEQVMENRRLRQAASADGTVRVNFYGETFEVRAGRRQVIELLLSTYDDAVNKQRELVLLNRELSQALEVNKTLQRNYLSALENSADAVFIVSLDNLVRFANQAARGLFGKTRDELVDRPFVQELKAGEVAEIEVEVDGVGRRVAEARVSRTVWEGEGALLASLRDVTTRVAMRDKLENMAFTDDLTRLFNRRGLLSVAASRCVEIRGAGGRFVVFFADLDGLKWINDNLGHADGDQALKDAAAILVRSFRKTDVIARLGGDEYAAVAMNLRPGEEDFVRRRIEANIREHNESAGRRYQVSMSIGVVASDTMKGDVETLIEAADQLMYEEKKAKRQRRGQEPGGPSSTEDR